MIFLNFCVIKMDKRLQRYALCSLSQAAGLISVILVLYLTDHKEGLNWNIQTRIFVHPVMMVIGLIYLQGTSITAFRALNDFERLYVKYLHAGLHTATFIFTVVGLCAVFDFKKFTRAEHLTTFHGIFGIIIVILFSAQWFFSLLGFLYPKVSQPMRQMFMPYHRVSGFIILSFSVINALIGLSKFNLSSSDNDIIVATSFLILIFGLSIAILVQMKHFKRENIND